MAYCDCREELDRAYATTSGDPSASADRAAHGRTSNLYFAWPILAHLEEARGDFQVQGLLLCRRMESEKEGMLWCPSKTATSSFAVTRFVITMRSETIAKMSWQAPPVLIAKVLQWGEAS